jgi:hypothetical protein
VVEAGLRARSRRPSFRSVLAVSFLKGSTEGHNIGAFLPQLNHDWGLSPPSMMATRMEKGISAPPTMEDS